MVHGRGLLHCVNSSASTRHGEVLDAAPVTHRRAAEAINNSAVVQHNGVRRKHGKAFVERQRANHIQA